MNEIHMFLFAVMQGITELFPVSSLGHGVLLPAFLGWDLNRNNPDFLPFLVVLHLGTASALLFFFWRDWKELLTGFVQAKGYPANPQAKILWLLVFATIPAGLLGLLLEKKLRLLFGSITIVAIFLIVNGAVLLIGDTLKRRRGNLELENMGWGKAVFIGFAQALALIPGISRSGVTLVAGLANGLNYGASARFSFLMATPIIGAAGILEVPKLLRTHAHMEIGPVLLSGILSGVFAYLSTWVLMRYFNSHEIKALRPFAFYCMAAGIGMLGWYFL